MVNLKIKTLVVGPLLTNCYIVADRQTKQALILDPGAESKKILSTLRATSYVPHTIIVTHCHFDHIGAVAQLKRKLKIPFLIPKGEEEILATAKSTSKLWTGQAIETPPKPDGLLQEGGEIKIGKVKFKVISTPGHSPAGISLYAKDARVKTLKNAKGVLFSGDTLFAGSIGRIDLPGGSDEEMGQSLRKLLKLPDETLVFPGHGEKTTIGKERKTNLFCRTSNSPLSKF